MKDLGRIFQPEISPVHKVDFSIATILKLEDAELTEALKTGYIPAGTLLARKDDQAQAIVADPTKKATPKFTAGQATGVLMHDVEVEAGEKEYSIGVMISGVLYEDVMNEVNKQSGMTVAENKEALAKQGILFYNVKTLKKK